MPALLPSSGLMQSYITSPEQGLASLCLAVAMFDPALAVPFVPPTEEELTDSAECGFSMKETAELLGFGSADVVRRWAEKLCPGVWWLADGEQKSV